MRGPRDVTTLVLQMGDAANLRAEGLKVSEIASRLGLKQRTVERRLALARQFVTLTQNPRGRTAPEETPSAEGVSVVDDVVASCDPSTTTHQEEQEDAR